jgi:hypothetical protein
MGIETYGSMVFSSMKQILNDVHDTDVSVPDRILWCYGEYQTLYGTVDGVDFQQGLPDLDNLDPREKHLIILDDLMDETDQRVASLFTKKNNGVLLHYSVSMAAARGRLLLLLLLLLLVVASALG